MTLYAYCVRRRGDPPPEPGLRGIGGAEVVRVEGDALGLWASRVEAVPAPGPERLREHDRVVRAALRTCTPLPLRFGAAFPDAGAALAALEPRAAELLAALERVAGRVEMGVTLHWEAEAERARLLAGDPGLRPLPGPPSGGREYLETRRREHALERALRRRAEALLEAASERLRALVPDAPEVRTVLPRPEVAGTLAHLVQKEQMFTYRHGAERAGTTLPAVTLRVSGPWAPYSFV
jgi:hypothetical protein